MSKRKISLPSNVHSLLRTKLMIIIIVSIIAITAGASFAIITGVSKDLPQISIAQELQATDRHPDIF